ncbi:HAD family hydrolase [Leptotrichia sp. oral taxon 223]|uniref:HAD family hydrolase n=1 Tax=Leptotrichia sp. oral taxon 223 TaxID=712363 RepID=UPI0015B914D4|nr:HAD family hydrolase [Leptotrichia sp. oral taxon 223]NWO18330.1 HAD family hydrolase [Leptotrichia sp. oral taxon 223]
MKYDLVIFDLDGTLMDTSKSITKTVNSAMEELGKKQYSIGECVKFVGGGVSGLARNILGKEKYEDVTKEEMEKVIRKYYDIYFDYGVEPYEGIPELLDFLEKNGVKKGIVTNKDHKTALSAVDKKLSKWKFDGIFGSNEKEYPNKPNPYNVDKMAQNLNISKEKILFVGDMLVDVNTAKNAGIDIVYCKWGFGEVKGEDGIDEDVKVSSVREIIEKIEGE